jgi:hypothetical protein
MLCSGQWSAVGGLFTKERIIMSFPEHIRTGFDFEEAIWLVELSRRAYQIFEYESGRDIGELYSSLYPNEEWHFVHAISDYDTNGRALIVKRAGKNQYAVVFRGSIITGEGIELTDLETTEQSKMVEYPPVPREAIPPSRNVRVHEGMLKNWDAFRDEIEFFFNILVSSTLEQRLLVDLVDVDAEERTSRIAAIGAAVRVRYGVEVEQKVVEAIRRTVEQLVDGLLDISQVSFEELVSKEVRFHRVLTELSETREGGAFLAYSTDLEVYVTGHSLGAGLATHCALYLHRYWRTRPEFPPYRLKMYNFASPKVGNKTFAEYYNRHLKGFSFRVQNLLDNVTYEPRTPFPYNIQLMFPGVDYIRKGDDFYAHFQHVDEAFILFGLGNQKFDLNFGGPFKLTIPMPFPHGADGYKDMLIEMQKRSENFWKPAQSFANLILAEQRENLEALRKQIVDVQDRVKAFSNETQAKPEINGELVAIKGQIAEVRRMVENLQQTISRSDPEKQIVALQKQLAEMKKMFVNLQDKRGE